jgi:uncharacterized protein
VKAAKPSPGANAKKPSPKDATKDARRASGQAPRKASAKTKAAAAAPVPARKSPRFAGRIQARKSGVHGKGVFALVPIAKGEDVIEYTGKIITWKQAQAQHPHNPKEPNHTFFFHIDEQRVIDGLYGNIARWINHSCAPNCEADEDEGRVFIKALRSITTMA